MRPLSADDVIVLWENAASLGPMERACTLAAAGAGTAAADVGRLPVGRCHGRLLELREALFGSDLEATSSCPGCGEAVEFGLTTTDLILLADKIVDHPDPVTLDGWRVEWRPVTGDDMAAAAMAADEDVPADIALLDRCIIRAESPGGDSVRGDDIGPELRAAVAAAMAGADPLAEILVVLTCPSCSREFRTELDPAAFVWAEVKAYARRLLLEVDALAGTYGWSQAEVLALSATRRAAYLRILAEGTP